jgi:hypothetical protein
MVVELDRVIDSCGYGVPLFKYQGEEINCKPGPENADSRD